MIFRLSQKLNTKIKAGTLRALPLDENPLADWSAHLFAERNPHIGAETWWFRLRVSTRCFQGDGGQARTVTVGEQPMIDTLLDAC